MTITALNGFTGSVGLKASITPSASGVTMGFNPGSVTLGTSSSGQSTLTVTTNRKTTRRSYTITVTGTSGSLVHAATVTLTVG